MGIHLKPVESLSILISNKNYINIILITICKPTNGDIKACGNCFKNLFAKNGTMNKDSGSMGVKSFKVKSFTYDYQIYHYGT